MEDMKTKIIALYKKVFQFIVHGVWQLDNTKLKKRDAFFVQQLKIFIIAVRSFMENRVGVQGAALTYYTVMAVVPLAAIVFAVAKGLGMHEQLNMTITNTFENQEDIIQWILDLAEKAIGATRGGILGSISVVFLLWSSMKVMINIEMAFNRVWQVKKARPWARKFTEYLAVLIIAPIFLAAASTISYNISIQVDHMTRGIPILANLAPSLGYILPFVLIIIMLMLIYMVIPYTKVKIAPAFYAAVITGIMFQLVQTLYVSTQVSVGRYSAIYAAFAIIPLFLIWVNISWSIVLFGTELSFAYQNVERYNYELTSKHISIFQHKLVALMVMHIIIKNFMDNKPPMTSNEISKRATLPVRLVRNTVNDLTKAQLLSEVVMHEQRKDENAYQPAIDVHSITISLVVGRIENLRKSDISEKENQEMKKFTAILSKYEKIFSESNEDKLLMNL